MLRGYRVHVILNEIIILQKHELMRWLFFGRGGGGWCYKKVFVEKCYELISKEHL